METSVITVTVVTYMMMERSVLAVSVMTVGTQVSVIAMTVVTVAIGVTVLILVIPVASVTARRM